MSFLLLFIFIFSSGVFHKTIANFPIYLNVGYFYFHFSVFNFAIFSYFRSIHNRKIALNYFLESVYFICFSENYLLLMGVLLKPKLHFLGSFLQLTKWTSNWTSLNVFIEKKLAWPFRFKQVVFYYFTLAWLHNRQKNSLSL